MKLPRIKDEFRMKPRRTKNLNQTEHNLQSQSWTFVIICKIIYKLSELCTSSYTRHRKRLWFMTWLESWNTESIKPARKIQCFINLISSAYHQVLSSIKHIFVLFTEFQGLYSNEKQISIMEVAVATRCLQQQYLCFQQLGHHQQFRNHQQQR